jgi:hypothetical protein
VPAWLAAAALISLATTNGLAVFVGWRFARRFAEHERANVQIQREVVDRLALVGELLLTARDPLGARRRRLRAGR